MKISKLFKATDKLNNTYLYAYINTDAEQKGCMYIHLFNITTQSNTDVEQEWFNQRNIKPLKDENGTLTLNIDNFAKEVENEGNLYYVDGEHYVYKNEVFKYENKQNADCFFNDQQCIYVEHIGTILPYVASDGMEFVRI